LPDQEEAVRTPDLSSEIGSSLASVWARYVGARPTNAEIHLDGSAVRWTIVDGAREFEEGMNAVSDDPEKPRPVRTVASYRRETSAAVAKATHRGVTARISKEDKKTGTTTETFILEPKRVRN